MVETKLKIIQFPFPRLDTLESQKSNRICYSKTASDKAETTPP